MSEIEFFMLPERYAFLSVSFSEFSKIKNNIEYFSVIKEMEGVTIILHEKELQKDKVDTTNVDKGYRVVTYQENTSLELIGFLALVSKILAENNISVNAVAGYNRDYFLIKEKDSEKAIKVLNSI